MSDRSAAGTAPLSPDAGPIAKSGHAIARRPEIDGLRSFAILPILLLHCGLSWLRGGFIGVDIFFVISGYLLTAIITHEIAGGSFTLAAFYRRRIVRILPALLAMVAIVLALGCVLLFPNPLRDLGRSAAAVAAFGSNIYFYVTSDYFAQASDMKPLVHTWSLAVEEQFYLLYPLLLISLSKLSNAALRQAMIALAVASFALGAWLSWDGAATAGFYLLPARIWELLVGGLVALGVHPRIASLKLRDLLCWSALAGIVLCCLMIKPDWPFPVPFALPPAMGAAILLAYAPQTSAAAFLSWRLLRWVGLISYSLYLWHRPIIAYYLLGRAITPTATDTVIVLGLSFAAAWLSYVLIERPALRRWRSGGGLALYAAALAMLALVAGAGLLVAARAERMRALPPQVAKVASYLGFEASTDGKRQFGTDRCFVIPTGSDFNPDCLRLAADRPNVLLVGDSHAAQLSQALRDVLGPRAQLQQATAAGCRPVLAGRGLNRCRRVRDLALREMDFTRVSAVILAGRWLEEDPPLLAQTAASLRARHVRVVVVGPVVEYDADVPDLLARAMLAGDPEQIAAARVAARFALDPALCATATAAGAAYISNIDIECPRGRCRLLASDGAPMHIDHSHLSPAAARDVAERIAALLPTGR